MSTLGAMSHYFLVGNRDVDVDEWVRRVAAEETPRGVPWARAISALAAAASAGLWKGLVGFMEQARSIAEDHGDTATVLRCRLWRAHGELETRGNVDPVADVFEDAVAAGPDAAEIATGAALELVSYLAASGRATDAVRQLAATREVTRRVNRTSTDVIVQVAELRCLVLFGRYDAASSLYESSLRDTPLARRQAALAMAWLALHRADGALAADLLAQFADAGDDHPVISRYIVPTVASICDVLDGKITAAAERVARMLERPLVLSLWLPLSELGIHCAISLGDRDAATAVLEPMALRASSARSPYYEGSVAVIRAALACDDGDPVHAEELVHTILPIIRTEGLVPLTLNALETLGVAAGGRGQTAAAARLLAAAEAQRQRIGYTWRWPHQREALDRTVALAEHELHPDELAAIRRAADDLDLDTAVAIAQRRRGQRGRPSHGWHSLTPTELDVTSLVGEGLSNRAIAERLLVSEATVRTHLNHVYTKLAIPNRARLVIEAHRRNEAVPDPHP